jgi:hypothetical protein
MNAAGLNQSLVKVKALFFDRQAVIRCVDKAILKNLNYIGGYIKRVAKNSIKKASARHAVSTVGKPPLSHTGLLKQHIYYAFDPQAQSVVVGPALLNAKGKNAPHNLEYCGLTHVNHKKFSIRPRPYMRPAMEKRQSKIADIWKYSVKKDP